VRTKQPDTILVNGADRLLVRDRPPDQAVHVFYRLDFASTTLISPYNTAGEAHLLAHQSFMTQ
jgi:hypothetical protein